MNCAFRRENVPRVKSRPIEIEEKTPTPFKKDELLPLLYF